MDINLRMRQTLSMSQRLVITQRLQQALAKDGHRIETFVDSRSAIARITEKRFDIVVTDIRMDEIDGIDVLNAVVEKGENTKVIMITGYATIEIAREATIKGAFDFISKPFKPNDLRAVISKAAKALKEDAGR